MAEPDSYSEDGMNRILLQLRAEAEQPAEPGGQAQCGAGGVGELL